MPAARRPLVWSICRMAFFFTMPNSSSSPNPDMMVMSCPVTSMAKSPNGTASGSVIRIVTGWMNDSNCAARAMYMKMKASANATAKL